MQAELTLDTAFAPLLRADLAFFAGLVRIGSTPAVTEDARQARSSLGSRPAAFG